MVAEGLRIGVLALQGAFEKHGSMLSTVGANPVEVRRPEDLSTCQGLIIPGGESTVILKQMHFIHLVEPLKEFAKKKPVFGTCAGLILMSQMVLGDSVVTPLHLLDVTVERNAFGRQIESFETEIDFHSESGRRCSVPVMFIRAPRIRQVGEGVKVLARWNDEPVMVQQGMHLGAVFHPELTSNASIHQYFLRLVNKHLT